MSKQWTDFPREDLNHIPFMIENGWAKEFHSNDIKYKRTTPDNVPNHGVSFNNANGIHAWKIRDGWQTALLKDSKYQDHKPMPTLEFIVKYFKSKNNE